MLDELRGGGMQVSDAISDLLLKSVDVMRDMLRSTQAKENRWTSRRFSDLQFDLELYDRTEEQQNGATHCRIGPQHFPASNHRGPGPHHRRADPH